MSTQSVYHDPQPHFACPRCGWPAPDGELTEAALAAVRPARQKEMLGEKLYAAIQKSQPQLAGKITGMMLEMDNSELLALLKPGSEAQLQRTVSEAMRSLGFGVGASSQ